MIDPDVACVHCNITPPKRPRSRISRYLAMAVFGATATVTLMACYGMSYSYCEETGECGGCTRDADCSSGEYCDLEYDVGQCTWGGLCDRDAECSPDMHCDEGRSTCTPGAPPELTCGVGSRRDPVTQQCVSCEGSACGSCLEEATCGSDTPECPVGTRAAVENGCYTGACLDAATCQAETCATLDEAACLANASCEPLYTGVNCTSPEGEPCSQPSAMCTCESFVFAECAAPAP